MAHNYKQRRKKIEPYTYREASGEGRQVLATLKPGEFITHIKLREALDENDTTVWAALNNPAEYTGAFLIEQRFEILPPKYADPASRGAPMVRNTKISSDRLHRLWHRMKKWIENIT